MPGYPPGAGPYAGAFGGDVYVPPALTPDTSPGSSTPPPPIILTAQAAQDAAGRTVAAFVAPQTLAWWVRRIVVQSTVAGTALVYVGPPGRYDAGYLVSGTRTGDFDENDTNQPIYVPAGQALSVVWQAGGTASARIEYLEA